MCKIWPVDYEHMSRHLSLSLWLWFRKPAADAEADSELVSIDVKLGDQEFPMTVETPALFVLGGPIKPTDAEILAFL